MGRETHHIFCKSTKGSNTGAWLNLLNIRPELGKVCYQAFLN